jgi:hypothetical protein
MREKRADANLRAKFLPAQPMSAEVIVINKKNKMWIPNVDHRSSDIADAWQFDRARHHSRNSHLALNQVKRVGSLKNPAGAKAAMRSQLDTLPALTTGKPRSNAPRSIPRKLRLAAIRIEQPQKKNAVGPSIQKLNPIRPDAGIPCTQLARKISMAARSQRLLNDKKVIAASMRFDERNHSSIVPQRFSGAAATRSDW